MVCSRTLVNELCVDISGADKLENGFIIAFRNKIDGDFTRVRLIFHEDFDIAGKQARVGMEVDLPYALPWEFFS